MLIRKATPEDNPAIMAVVNAADLFYSGLDMKNFYVAEKNGQICGIAKVDEDEKLLRLSSLGTRPEEQGQGVASALLGNILAQAKKPVYLSTIIPNFFKKFGFVAIEPPPNSRLKINFNCSECFPELCVCMVKTPPNIPPHSYYKKLTIDDSSLLQELFRKYPKNICELSMNNLFLWEDFDRPQLTIINNNLCVLISPLNEPPYFLEPLGEERLLETANVCLNLTGRLSRATKDFVALLPPKIYQVKPLRDHFDYIYEIKELRELKGKKYDGKRNHIKNFQTSYPGYKTSHLTASRAKEVLALFDKWCEGKKQTELSYRAQRNAIGKVFYYFDKLSFSGLLVSVNDQMIGFIIGSELTPAMATVHFQYTDPAFAGASQFVLWEACRSLFNKYELINLEQDLGIEGLRKAKLSYQPLRLEEKFEVNLPGAL